MTGFVNQYGAKSGIIQGYRPHPNVHPEQRATSGMTYERNHRSIPNYDRPGDGPYTPDIHTSLLIRSDATNNGGHFSDFSFYRHTVNKSGSVKHDTAWANLLPRLGNTGMNFHNNNSYLRFDDHDAFHSGTEWTIDFWFKGEEMSGGQHTNSGNGNPRDTFFLGNTDNSGTNRFGFYGYSTSGDWKAVSPGSTNDAIHHYAIVVMGDDINNGWSTDSRSRRILFFKDGKLLSNQSWGNGGGNSGQSYFIGVFRESNASQTWSNGGLMEYRHSKGIARWTNDFKVWK